MTKTRTFREWEMEMSKRLIDVQKATETIAHVICSTPLRQTVEEKLVAIDGLNALERRLRGELNRATRKHIKRQKTRCQACGEYRAAWRTEKGQYLCTDCACSRCDIRTRTPLCECCGMPLYGVTAGWRTSETCQLYCSRECALKGRGCEPMTEEMNDED